MSEYVFLVFVEIRLRLLIRFRLLYQLWGACAGRVREVRQGSRPFIDDLV